MSLDPNTVKLLAIVATYVGISLVSLYVLWILFLAIMSLKRSYDDKTISKPALV